MAVIKTTENFAAFHAHREKMSHAKPQRINFRSVLYSDLLYLPSCWRVRYSSGVIQAIFFTFLKSLSNVKNASADISTAAARIIASAIESFSESFILATENAISVVTSTNIEDLFAVLPNQSRRYLFPARASFDKDRPYLSPF